MMICQPCRPKKKNSRICIEPNCNTRPVYNFSGETKGIYCAEHKKPDMIDVKNPRCIEPNCNKQPVYNFSGETKGIYCAEHKKPDMIDVISPRCIEPNCNKHPVYNFSGETKAIYCVEHKKPDMIDVKNPRCKTELCDTQTSNKKYKGYCIRCFIYLFPNEPVLRNYKTKESSVTTFIKEKFFEYNWITDKVVSGGCSRRRPDLYYDFGNKIIIVEIDENQHQDYDYSCENRRLMEISRDFGHIPIVFIRFNPDDYIEENKKVTSCWGTDKRGLCVVKKSKTAEWNQRLNVLQETLKYWIENETEKTIEVVQLFYDC